MINVLRNVLVATVVMLAMASCGSKKTAFNYSQEIVKKEQSLVPDIEKTEQSVKTFLETGLYDSIAVAGERMEKMVDGKLNEIKNMPAPDAKGSESFKAASVRYFEFIKSMYTGYKDYGHATTEEARGEQMSKLQYIVEKKNAAINDMQSAQKKFADDNQFKLEDKTIN